MPQYRVIDNEGGIEQVSLGVGWMEGYFQNLVE